MKNKIFFLEYLLRNYYVCIYKPCVEELKKFNICVPGWINIINTCEKACDSAIITTNSDFKVLTNDVKLRRNLKKLAIGTLALSQCKYIIEV